MERALEHPAISDLANKLERLPRGIIGEDGFPRRLPARCGTLPWALALAKHDIVEYMIERYQGQKCRISYDFGRQRRTACGRGGARLWGRFMDSSGGVSEECPGQSCHCIWMSKQIMAGAVRWSV